MMHDLSPGRGREVVSWWATVTQKELASSSGLVASLLNPGPDLAETNPTALARALALQQLFDRKTLLHDLLQEVNEKIEEYSQLDAAGPIEEVDAWLRHCELLQEVFRQSLEMLRLGDKPVDVAPVNAFSMRVELFRGHLIGLQMSKGIGQDIPVAPPLRLRRRDSV